MKIKIDNEIVESTRLHSQKSAAEKLGVVPSTVFIMKLKGLLTMVNIGGFDLVVEPLEGFESLRKKKKK